MQIIINQGDDFSMYVTVTDSKNNPVDMTGKEFIFYGKYEPMQGKDIAFTGKVVVSGNELHCTIPYTETGKLENPDKWAKRGKIYYDIYCKTTHQRLLSGPALISTGISYRRL
jgi:hypothetical protein|nr:MAG TPA: BppU domain protein [Caudoviricetes sp.]DAN13436.1 MAG TPA: BppU domain protein [Caudoviricetes sp.]DAX18518.1 MAG TPA: BppU domain protein [Caudoviricetes sp.]